MKSELVALIPARLRALLFHGGEGESTAGRRNRSILVFFATSLASRGVGIVCQLVQVPVALRFLGNEAFGLWATLAGVSFMLSVADFGIGLGAQNRIAEAWGAGDHARARRVFFTALCALGGIAVLLVAIALPACLLADWRSLLKLTDPKVIAEVHGGAMIVVVCCAGGIAVSMGQRLAFAVQRGWLINAMQSLGSVLGTAGIGLACWQHWGLRAFLLATFLPIFALNLVLTCGLAWHLGWLRRWADIEFARSELRSVVSVGMLFFVQQLCSLSLFAMPAVLISSLLGAAAVTPFNLAQRLYSLLLVIPNAFLPPLWPAYSEAKAKGDWPWVRRTLHRSLAGVALLTLLPMAAAAVFGREVLLLWTRGPASVLPSAGLLALLFVWNAAVVLAQPFSFLLSGMSEVRRLTAYSVATAVLTVALIFLLAPRWGLEGVACALIISTACFSLFGAVVETRKFLRTVSDAAPAPLLVESARPHATTPLA